VLAEGPLRFNRCRRLLFHDLIVTGVDNITNSC
jgi:hypothetical protein